MITVCPVHISCYADETDDTAVVAVDQMLSERFVTTMHKTMVNPQVLCARTHWVLRCKTMF